MNVGDLIEIEGNVWNVRVLSIKETFSVLYTDNTGRTLLRGAPLTLDPLGTFYTHEVEFARRGDAYEEFDNLFSYLSRPRSSGIKVKIAHGQGRIEYNAYVSAGERELVRLTQDGTRIWDKFTAKFTPIEAQVVPT